MRGLDGSYRDGRAAVMAGVFLAIALIVVAPLIVFAVVLGIGNSLFDRAGVDSHDSLEFAHMRSR